MILPYETVTIKFIREDHSEDEPKGDTHIIFQRTCQDVANSTIPKKDQTNEKNNYKDNRKIRTQIPSGL